MKFFTIISFFLALATDTFGDEHECGPDDSQWIAAGSTTAYNLAIAWAEDYSEACPAEITVEGGGSSMGAKLVCGDDGDASIGMMVRGWKDSEATPNDDGFTYTCEIGDKSYTVAQIVVANDGITVLSQEGGDASECLEMLGEDGLSADQLRWIFSSYTEEELIATGWDPDSILSDGDDSTHYWSELHKDCVPHPIIIASPNDASGTYEFFEEAIITDASQGETIRYDYMAEGHGEVTEVLDALEEDEDAIGFVGYPFYALSKGKFAVPINGVEPTEENISEGEYSTLGRQIYMNLRLDSDDAKDTIPYIHFGLNAGTVEGYVPLSEDQMEEMEGRLQSSLSL